MSQPLQDPQEEQFCQALMQGGDAKDVWVKIYGEHPRAKQRAYEMRHRKRIEQRLDDLAKDISPEFARVLHEVREKPKKLPDRYVREEFRAIAKQLGVDEFRIIKELLKNLDIAQKGDDIRAANECVKLLGAEIGMFRPPPPEKQETSQHLHLHSNEAANWKEIASRLLAAPGEEPAPIDGECTSAE